MHLESKFTMSLVFDTSFFYFFFLFFFWGGGGGGGGVLRHLVVQTDFEFKISGPLLLDTAYCPHRARLPRRKLYLWRKPDTQGIKQHLKSFSTSFIKSSEHDSSPTDQQPNSIEFMWSKFKDAVTSAVDKYVPTKMSSTRQTHPWVDTKLRRLMRQKQRAHWRAKKTQKRDTGSGTKIYKGVHRMLQGKLKRHTSKRL